LLVAKVFYIVVEIKYRNDTQRGRVHSSRICLYFIIHRSGEFSGRGNEGSIPSRWALKDVVFYQQKSWLVEDTFFIRT
jgi:hypothetical protein